jgi:hypothetical protein
MKYNTKVKLWFVSLALAALSFVLVEAYIGPLSGEAAVLQLEDSATTYVFSQNFTRLIRLIPLLFVVWPVWSAISELLKYIRNTDNEQN